ncbi:uncharacterized protein LOC126750595 [Anthonomus grandis grandis]|uniref:uncharacterized protein LOC126750595 n=1 Tax=Anthonomus grandis grandis TaxID=2921223 RepID=UPI002165793A|nr:uncharacterized protein LOC126750595 [Anthonomus grandis grandis]
MAAMVNEIELIENVRNHECLFNVKSRHYRNQSMRQEAWEEIAKEINSPLPSVRETWTKLRNAFLNAKKRRQTKSGQETTKVVPWKYEQEMSFLIPHLECRQTKSNLESQKDQPNVIDDESTGSDDVINNTLQESITLNADNLTQTQHSSTDTPVISTPIHPKYSQKKARLSSKDISLNPTEEMVRIMKQNAEARNERRNKINSDSPSSNLDEVDMFYLSMAKTVKRLPQREQAYIRMEFCRMVSEAEIRNLDAKSLPVSVTISTDNQSTSTSSLQSTPLHSPTDLSTQYNNCPSSGTSTSYVQLTPLRNPTNLSTQSSCPQSGTSTSYSPSLYEHGFTPFM